jgi:hypothetical protein
MPMESVRRVPPRIWSRFGLVVLWLFTMAPFGLALLAAVRAPRMHVLLDYWHVLAKITNDDGSLLLSQVFTYHLEQPFVLPSLLFWAGRGDVSLDRCQIAQIGDLLTGLLC